MQLPLEITFRNMPKQETIGRLVYKKAEKLEQVCDYITSCRVAIEQAQKHQQSGHPQRVRLDITVPPGKEIVVTRESGQGDMHAEHSTVVRDAFEAACRQLRELVEKQRGEVKTHPQQQAAPVVEQLFPDEGYGFLRTVDGRQIYFHRNSVLSDDFARLEIGTGVRFAEGQGEDGPQATVQIVDKPEKK